MNYASLFQSLLEIFKDNQLEYPIEKQELGDINEFMQDPAANLI